MPSRATPALARRPQEGVESWASRDTQHLLFDLSVDFFSQRVLCHQVTPVEIVRFFGGERGFEDAVQGLARMLYAQ